MKQSVSPKTAFSFLTVKDLSWSVAEKTILHSLGFAMPAGTMLGIIGPNGAGKSSLLRCLYRYIKPTTGSLLLAGKNINELTNNEFAKKVAVVQQETSLQFGIRVWDFVAMGLTPHKGWFELDSADDKQRINQALARVGLEHYELMPLEHLSGGERQRALIARAIVQQPELLILDEPTNHLDVSYQIQLLALVKSLDMTVITSIHDLNLASAMCDQLLLLDKGRLIQQGTPTEVLTQARIAEVFGVKAWIKPHPEHGGPLISYSYVGNESTEDNA